MAEEKPVVHHIWSRRDFFSVAGWGGFMGAIGLGSLGMVRMLYPRVLFEPPTRFNAGRANEYAIGEVNTKWMKEWRTWIIRDNDGIVALSGICTHLGCTPKWLPSENKFKCPCHGSGFRGMITKGAAVSSDVIGSNFEGPAPRPLERYKVFLDDFGNIIVDKSVSFAASITDKSAWAQPGAKLMV